ncbi:hypothetical protein HPB47_019229 [Ixodes persulcatus]|uniref:Uncharacterized protein n=1 Tax=Ixodes persulcatus TaxID=34615 RepID=A0AC60QMB9_IXOPE|nr:hypothetical protein HPB47_019229 [Ixodes persulcatus]
MPRVSQFDQAPIIALAQAGVSQGAIAALVGHTRKSVRRWIKAYQQEARLEDASHARRQRGTTEQQDMLIVAAIIDNTFLTLRQLKTELRLSVSDRTIARRLRCAGLKCRVACRKPLLSQEHRQLRLEFAERYAGWRDDQWKLVVFTDEASFSSKWDQRLQVWRPVCMRYKYVNFLKVLFYHESNIHNYILLYYILLYYVVFLSNIYASVHLSTQPQ